MSVISKEIRKAIKDFLDTEGRSKSSDILRYVTEEKKICSPTPCYRELKFLVNTGTVREHVINKSRTDYESVSDQKNQEQWIEHFKSKLSEFDKQCKDIDKNIEQFSFEEKVNASTQLIKFLVFIREEFNMMRLITSFKKSPQYTALENEFEKNKNLIVHTAFHHKATKKERSDLFKKIMNQFVYDQIKSKEDLFYMIHRPG